MAGRQPSTARTPQIRGPNPNAESTPLPRNLSVRQTQPSSGARTDANRDERRLASRIDEELTTERGDSLQSRPQSRMQSRRVDSNDSATDSESASSPVTKRVRDANRNVQVNRYVDPATAASQLSRPDASNRGNRNPAAKRSVGPRNQGTGARKAPRRSGVPGRRRARPYSRVLREIHRFRVMHGPEAYGLLIRRAPFSRLVREVTNEVRDTHRLNEPIRWHVEALLALQEASEALLAHFFEDTNVLAAHAKRITVMNRDAHTLMRLRQDR